jgi:3-methyladenine DNA glycosylase AlkD
MSLKEIQAEIKSHYSKERAEHSKRFFKTGKGEYGEGDIFYGLSVPEIRILARKYNYLELDDIQGLLDSEVHEERLLALIIMTKKFQSRGDDPDGAKSTTDLKKSLFEMYLKNYKNINNWDLVDLSAPNIVGSYLLDKDRKILYELAKSDNLWKKRIAILSSFMFIRHNDFKDSLAISYILLNDTHDLIHKAVGWALREIGKRDLKTEEDFLKKHYKKMPRTMLRYAIEKFEEKKRLRYLRGTI